MYIILIQFTKDNKKQINKLTSFIKLLKTTLFQKTQIKIITQQMISINQIIFRL